MSDNYISVDGNPLLVKVDGDSRIDVPDVVPNSNQQQVSFNNVKRDSNGLPTMTVDGVAIVTEADILTQHHENINFYKVANGNGVYKNFKINDKYVVTEDILENIINAICPLLSIVSRLVYTETDRCKFANGQRLAISTYRDAFNLGKNVLFLTYNEAENWFNMPDYRWLGTRFSDGGGGGAYNVYAVGYIDRRMHVPNIAHPHYEHNHTSYILVRARDGVGVKGYVGDSNGTGGTAKDFNLTSNYVTTAPNTNIGVGNLYKGSGIVDGDLYLGNDLYPRAVSVAPLIRMK